MHSHQIRRWNFILADVPDAWAKGYDDSAWRAVSVPHDWAVEQEFAEAHSSGTGYLPGGIGWYRAHVALHDVGEVAGKHVRLKFGGVYKNAQVWVNGYHVGGRPNGWAEFSFDLSEIVSYASGDDLVVCVRVEHTDISDSRWYNGTGITRQVEIEVHEPVRVSEYGAVFETASADTDEATVRIALQLCNDTGEAVSVDVQNELRSLTGGKVHTFATRAEIPAGGTADAMVTGKVPEPELWSDTAPNLYRLTTTLSWLEGGETRRAVYAEVVGIRTFRFDPAHGFFINGQARTLKGVCLHEDAGPFGTAVPTSVWLRRLLKLKDMGCNGVRMAHNPHAPELYRLCDALGFYVIDEAFDEWENPKNKWWQGHNVYPPRHQGYAKDFHAWHERDLSNMVEAHRNHPSIIAWSIGNEIDYPNDPYASALFAEMTGNNDARKTARQRTYDPNRPDARRLPTVARRLIDVVKARDTTRPVTLGAAYPELSSRTGLTELFDVIGYNYKEHLYEDDHARFPNLPILGSENGHRYTDWLAVADNDYISGQYLWTGIDYLGEAHGWPIHGSGAGLLTVAGFEKHTFHLRRSWWSDEPVAHIVTRPYVEAEDKNFWSHPIARTWDGTGEAIEILCFSNGEPRLTCNGEPLMLTRDDERGYWTAISPSRAGSLLLETLRDGQVVARDELGPRGDAVRLEASVWDAPAFLAGVLEQAGLPADGTVQIECVLRDANGEIARDERMVSADVSGGALLGIENGDLSDNTAYALPHRSTYEGRLIVFVRADGPARVRLSAPGLPDVEIACGQ
jgi:beta-galactosidase/beta-glucuronidase